MVATYKDIGSVAVDRTLTVVNGGIQGNSNPGKFKRNEEVALYAKEFKNFDKWVVTSGSVEAILPNENALNVIIITSDEDTTIEATRKSDASVHTHTYGAWSNDDADHWHECSCKSKKDVASHSFKWVIDKAATLTNTGLKHEECSICGYKKQAVTVSKRKPKKGDSFKDSKKNVYVITDVRKKTVAFKKMGNTKLKSFTVPSTITLNKQKYKVTQISDNVFKNNKIITKITIGSNVRSVGKNAFYGCKKLKTIIIKSTKLTSKTVSKNAFKGLTKATTIKVPKKKLNTYKKLFKSKGLSSKIKVKGY